MSVKAPHLQDERLVDCYYAEQHGDALDPPSAEHLSDCDACARRYVELGAFLTTLKTDADADIQALFPPELLRAQQRDIAKRIGLVGRAARVISFPGRFAAPKPQVSATRRITRWVTAAAAAGVFVGIAAGSLFGVGNRFDFSQTGRRSGSSRSGSSIASRQMSNAALPSRLPANVVSASDTDETFMSDLESALDRPHTRELLAFDALTPHMRDVRDLAR